MTTFPYPIGCSPNRVTGVGEGSSTHNVLTIQYHANGGRDRMIRAGGAQTRYAYDRAQRIDELTQNFDGTASDVTTAFDFNPAGQITRLARSNDLYHYYGNENKTGVYVSNGLNQYSSVNGRRYSYDANGNLTSDGVRNYDYDNENRLTDVTGGGDEATFEYDPLGRLFEVTVNGQTRQFLYDGDSLVAEYSSSGNTPVARYVHGDRVDEPWVRYNGSGIGQSRRVYLHTDHQGSIIAHSNSQGDALGSLTYDSYGVAGAENVGRFGYTGQLWLGDIGLYYYKARMYSPDIGRFLQTDPIGYEDQMNLYAYVHNDPMRYADPTGEASKIAWLIRLGADSLRKGARVSKKRAVQARRQGENVLADSRQMARQIETAAHGRSNQLRHEGHELRGGSRGRPHYQTEGKTGHSFWSVVAGTLAVGADVLDGVANAAEVVDPTTYITSGGDRYLDQEGNVVSYDELMDQINNSGSGEGESSNSENGMSGGNVQICSGMGAQKDGC